MTKKKIFILERSSLDETIKDILLKSSENDSLEIACYNEDTCDYLTFDLPASFDAYVVHIPFSSERALIKLKEEQPSSILYVRPKLLTSYVCPELRDKLFGIYTGFDGRDIIENLDKILNELGVLRK